MQVGQWEHPTKTVSTALRLVADMLDHMGKTGEVSFRDMAVMLHMLHSAEAVLQRIPEGIEVLRDFTNERTKT